jgi:L-threonylcarbamoyladenylate synthase
VTRRLPDDPVGQAAALDVLRAGGLVAFPTDTVYGLAVALATPGGIEKLYAAKHRPLDKAIIVLVDGLDQLAGLVMVPPAAQVLAGVGWPGGLTLVLPLRSTAQLPPALTAGTATLGVRVPDHPTPRTLARMLGPLPTTSANRSGEPDALDADEAESMLGGACELILDGGATRGGRPSTIIDCASDLPSVVRVGAIPIRSLAMALDAAGLRHAMREPAAPG